MFRHYDVVFESETGEKTVAVLRCDVKAQNKLKAKHASKSTRALFFKALDDDDIFLDILDVSLNWAGNSNEIKTGEELLEKLIDADMLGMEGRNRIVFEIGSTAGFISEKEKAAFLKKIDKKIEKMFDEELGDGEYEDSEEADEKNS